MTNSDKDMKYTYRTTWSEEDGECVGLCSEFPSLSWLAATPEEALTGIRKLVSDVLADMVANGEEVPEPISAKKFSGKILVRIPSNVHKELAIEAAEEGISLNRLINAKLCSRL